MGNGLAVLGFVLVATFAGCLCALVVAATVRSIKGMNRK